MGIVEDMAAFREVYHEYDAAVDRLRQTEDHYNHIVPMDGGVTTSTRPIKS